MKKIVAGFLVGVLTTVCIFMFANWFVHRHDDDVHVTVVSKEAETFVNESTGAVISTGLRVVVETDNGNEFYRVVENTAENNFDVYKVGSDFYIPEETFYEYWS